MVSSACRGSCPGMTLKSSTRALNIDRNKDYSVPLQVETSVEYDLPSHIYPPKGSEPILMIHPAYTTPVRARKVPVTSSSPVLSNPVSNTKPLSALQVNQQVTRTVSKTLPKAWCSCGNPNCNPSARVNSVRSSQQETNNSVLTSRQISQIPENLSYSSVKANSQSTELRSQQKQLQKAQSKQMQVQKQKQIQLQQQHLQQVHLQQQLQERAKLQAQQIHQLQPQQKSHNAATLLSRQQSNSDQILSWGVVGRCQGVCCQTRGQVLPTGTSEFLAPGLPPSLLTRTPTRGPGAGSSPKLRARTRRGLSVANTVNLPEYLGTTRSSRTCSVGGLVGGSSHAHTRTRSSSMLGTTPTSITAHQVASALDVVRAQILTPRSLLTSSQHFQSTLNTSSLLSTVGQSRDSGCSVSTELSTSGSNTNFSSSDSGKNVEWTWSIVDSGFCTPVDSAEDQVMETYDISSAAAVSSSYTPISSSLSTLTTSTKESNSNSSSLPWVREFATPLNSSSSMTSLHNSFLPPPNPHYIPQPIWNLAY